MNRGTVAVKAMATSALVLGWSVPLAGASVATVLMLGKSGYIIALGIVPVAATMGASLTSHGVARAAWRLALAGPVIMLATLGALVWRGWPLFSVDTAYWEPPVVGLIVLFAINSLILASSRPEGTAAPGARGKAQ